MNKRVTLKDIAKHLGVHVSTVSRALDPEKQSNLSADAITRVRDVARELGYRPNRLAAGLRTRKSMSIGIMIPDITNVIFPPIVRGIENVLEPRGYASILVNTDNIAEREGRLIQVLRDRGVDGIIHAAVLRDDPTISWAADEGLAVVTLNRKVDGHEIPYVINDEEDGIRMIVDHLYQLGHRRIAKIAGPQNLSTGLLRYEAFLQTTKEYGLTADPDLIEVAQQFEEEEGRKSARRLLDKGKPFTAVICANDRLALGALNALQESGLQCPDDVSLTGFNDMPFLDLIPPGLTTIRIRQFRAGQTCAQRLLDILDQSDRQAVAETILPVELVLRGSTAAPKS
ncbi:LacI family DNA-binding transcriptional regulator [Roseibium sp. MMSF_3544]|uniref:LacI family DNA-binding transcriptional regulator n=1 Tax=unclassified Roseibium TaxID=2629323 RepID=UPI00274005A0|nr:LacI family DNA-binding transcriptional regulator [Roseibium sp. MMSF_3544]